MVFVWDMIMNKNDFCDNDIHAFVNKHPESCTVLDRFEQFPLHGIFYYRPDSCLALIKLMVSMNPDALSHQDKWKQVPLHWACEKGSTGGTIQFLGKSYPDGLECRNKHGNLPLHCACYKNAPLDVVRWLVVCYPNGSMVRNDFGRLPIDFAKDNRKHVIVNFMEIAMGYGKFLPMGMVLDNANKIMEFESELAMMKRSLIVFVMGFWIVLFFIGLVAEHTNEL